MVRSSSSVAATRPADAVVADIRSAGGTAGFVVADLSAGEHDVRRLAERATAVAGGRIDILVNNAAMLLMPAPTPRSPKSYCEMRSRSTCSHPSC